ncbi:MAG TPA: SET domain-containing histone-lysine N-methyltransferase, partial [Hyalangium sp.]|nr:SET domain-containing histone-lysine N-methyltransferase [Hyalangium sp.]
CVLTVDDARASEIGRLLEAHASFDDERTYLVAFVLQERERGADSFWKPFVDILPKSFPTHPFFFNQDEISLLRGSFAYGMVEYQRVRLASRHKDLCQHVPGFQRFTLEQFIWAHFAVVSRTFSVMQGESLVTCMAPLADMINDGRPANSGWDLSADGQSFEVHVSAPIARGQEVLTTYGSRHNLHLLVQYGFIHADNAHDEVMLIFSLPLEDPLTEEKQRLLKLPSPHEPHSYKLQRQFDPKLMGEVLSFLRVAHAGAGELALLQEAPNALARAQSMLSVENEQKAVSAFVAACKERLAEYTTSLEEDERILREEKLSHNARSCVLLRRSEKQILQLYAHSCAGLL